MTNNVKQNGFFNTLIDAFPNKNSLGERGNVETAPFQSRIKQNQEMLDRFYTKIRRNIY